MVRRKMCESKSSSQARNDDAIAEDNETGRQTGERNPFALH